MKRVIRRGVFETNSSSTHSLTMASGEDYTKWENGEILFNDGGFFTKEEAIEELKNDKYFNKYNPNFDFSNEEAVEDALKEEGYYTYDHYWDYKCEEYETFSRSYKTDSGEEVVAFGYYGNN
jgi:hypothetical protein